MYQQYTATIDLSLTLRTLSDSVLSVFTFEDNIEYSSIGLVIMSTTSIGLVTISIAYIQ